MGYVKSSTCANAKMKQCHIFVAKIIKQKVVGGAWSAPAVSSDPPPKGSIPRALEAPELEAQRKHQQTDTSRVNEVLFVCLP